MARLFHVTSSRNRRSIRRHGLDWKRMASVRGIAGSSVPEQEGIFVCEDQSEIEWFSRMNATGGPLDIWAIGGIETSQLVESPEGYFYLPKPIPPKQLKLFRREISTPGNFG